MTAYEMLSEPIRKYIRDKKWEALRPIQTAAITKILSTDLHYILVSRTASGKTEAAFLPVLSAVNWKEPGIQVLYIAPLVALINDQFQRAELLCEYLDVPVTRWHGDANASAKKKLVGNPQGILLITPESIEALFTNHPERAKAFFGQLKFIIIDEIHSFLGNNRGLHVQSLVARVNEVVSNGPARIIGLSATIGEYEEVKRFTGEPERTRVLKDNTPREMNARFVYWPAVSYKGYADTFIDELYEETKDSKVLLFPNSRAKTEELAVKLKEKAYNKDGHAAYFAHHASIDKEDREYIEDFARNNTHHPFCIVCTSTLELGIDIGSVDLIVQVDATHSISSLIQRVGRSGRKENSKGNLLMYATNPWSLLQSLACWELYKEGFVEPLYRREKPFDVLFHQVLSLLKETSGITKQNLVNRLHKNPVFSAITEEEIMKLISSMISADYIEDLKRELIVGFKGEKITNDRDFYSMFISAEMFSVIHAGKKVGTLPFTPQVYRGLSVLLSAKSWLITHIDTQAKVITVVPAQQEGKPIFEGQGGDVHQRVEEKMLEILFSARVPEDIDIDAKNCLEELRSGFKKKRISDWSQERPVTIDQGQVSFYVLAGSKIYDTLFFLLRETDVEADKYCITLTLTIKLPALLPLLNKQLARLPEIINKMMDDDPAVFYTGKWGQYLPLDLKKQYVIDNEFDIPGTRAFLENLRFVLL